MLKANAIRGLGSKIGGSKKYSYKLMRRKTGRIKKTKTRRIGKTRRFRGGKICHDEDAPYQANANGRCTDNKIVNRRKTGTSTPKPVEYSHEDQNWCYEYHGKSCEEYYKK